MLHASKPETPMIEPTRAGLSLPEPQPRLRAAAQALEAGFLAEMLKAAGLGATPGFGGGPGQDQFSSYMLDAQAARIVQAGGIGLAETIYAAMLRNSGE